MYEKYHISPLRGESTGNTSWPEADETSDPNIMRSDRDATSMPGNPGKKIGKPINGT
jgi:hypothetical protein